MIKSMTGFAAISKENEAAMTSVTVKSVNHRFLDVQWRLPQQLAAAEQSLKSIVQRHVSRGRVEIAVTLQSKKSSEVMVELNEPFVAAVGLAIDRARVAGAVTGPLTPGDLLRFPQAIQIREQSTSPQAGEDVRSVVEGTLEEALVELDRMRVGEGRFLQDDLESRRRGLVTLVDEIRRAADQGREAFETRLASRVAELRVDAPLDPAVVAQEVVRIAARSDISEELVRLRAHLAHWAQLAEGPEPCGRKLDFLLQELNREINTIGSKAEGVRTPELVVHAKAELERVREQVQNVE